MYFPAVKFSVFPPPTETHKRKPTLTHILLFFLCAAHPREERADIVYQKTLLCSSFTLERQKAGTPRSLPMRFYAVLLLFVCGAVKTYIPRAFFLPRLVFERAKTRNEEIFHPSRARLDGAFCLPHFHPSLTPSSPCAVLSACPVYGMVKPWISVGVFHSAYVAPDRTEPRE